MTDSKQKIIDVFLVKLGDKIKAKRQNRGLKQEALAAYLEIDKTSISKYESGSVDFPISKLPLISKYCDTPLRDYFDDDIQSILTMTVKEMSMILAQKFAAKDKRAKARADKDVSEIELLVGHVYEKNGERYIKEKPQVIEPAEVKMTLRERCMRGDAYTNSNVIAFTDEEFVDYILNEDGFSAVIETGKNFYECIGDKKNRKLKETIADYVIGEVIVEPFMSERSWDALRAYAYYKKLIGK